MKPKSKMTTVENESHRQTSRTCPKHTSSLPQKKPVNEADQTNTTANSVTHNYTLGITPENIIPSSGSSSQNTHPSNALNQQKLTSHFTVLIVQSTMLN